MKTLTINQLDAIQDFNYALRRLTSECGIEEVARKTNTYLRSLPISYGVWELELIMTEKQAKDQNRERIEMIRVFNETAEKARKEMEAKIASGYFGINYGSEVQNAN